MYLPFAQQPGRSMTLIVRTDRDPVAMASAVREEVRAVDPDLPLGATATLEELVGRSVALPRLYLTFFGFFALVALLLAAIGIYGVTAQAVAQRTQEIGIRMALGAQRADVLGMIVRQSALLVGAGLGFGFALALLLSRTLDSLLFELSATDPLTYGTIAAVLAGVAMVASWMPARRATRVDPLVALRTE
jgi:ABC-type antimicrobial peptide transport system permease subunit